MKKKIIILIFILIIIGGIIFAILNNNKINSEKNKNTQEFIPQEEITDKSLRQTTVNLYFIDKQNKSLKAEGKQIDSNILLDNPYKFIVCALIEGPQSENLESPFPEKVRLIDTKLEKNCVILNFSEEILNYENDEQKYNIINCILNSLTQLNEVNSIKFTVNGETKDELNEEYCEIRQNTLTNS